MAIIHISGKKTIWKAALVLNNQFRGIPLTVPAINPIPGRA